MAWAQGLLLALCMGFGSQTLDHGINSANDFQAYAGYEFLRVVDEYLDVGSREARAIGSWLAKLTDKELDGII